MALYGVSLGIFDLIRIGDGKVEPYLALGMALGVWFFFAGWKAWRRLRWIEDTPTSKVRSMALGRVELHGEAEEKAALAAPFTGTACVYYRWTVEEYVRRGRSHDWKTVAQGNSAAWPFYLQDDTGRVLVDATGAELLVARDWRQVDPPFEGPVGAFAEERGLGQRRFGFKRELRFTEWRIEPGQVVYVLGVAQERGSIVHERRERITAKLAALRSDPDAMAHFDLDGDGHISGEEWEVARRMTLQQVESEGFDDPVVVARDRDDRGPFVISDRREEGLVGKLRLNALGGIYGGSGLAIACLGGLLFRLGIL
jgi:hypothetical protein